MLCFVLSNAELTKELSKELKNIGVDFKILDPNDHNILTKIYDIESSMQALICDTTIKLPQNALLDLLRSKSRHIPVILSCTRNECTFIEDHIDKEMISLLLEPKALDILNSLDKVGVLGLKYQLVPRTNISTYRMMVAIHLLKTQHSLSIITIHSSDFRKIALEYGAEAYSKLTLCFQEILLQVWGAKGSFRSRDMLLRMSENSNNFVIILESPRIEKKSHLLGC